MFCAAIPVTAAVGAKLNAGQLGRPEEQRKPVSKITSILLILLATGSIIYHALRWQN
jgi:hypothetical protein